jgi:hypothetical protein
MRNYIIQIPLRDQIKEHRIGLHVACMGKIRNAYKILVGKPELKRLHGRP